MAAGRKQHLVDFKDKKVHFEGRGALGALLCVMCGVVFSSVKLWALTLVFLEVLPCWSSYPATCTFYVFILKVLILSTCVEVKRRIPENDLLT